MTQQEYETKKRECWEEYWKPRKAYRHGDAAEMVHYDAFSFAFDRAYALGREVGQKGKPLYTYITDEDKENVRAEYNAMVKAYESPRNNGEKEYAKGYMEALEWLFGIRFLTNQQNDNE